MPQESLTRYCVSRAYATGIAPGGARGAREDGVQCIATCKPHQAARASGEERAEADREGAAARARNRGASRGDRAGTVATRGGGSKGGGDNPATNANNRPFPARLVVEGIAIFAGVIALVYVVKKIKYEWEQMKNLSSSSSKAKKQHGIDDGRSYALLNEGGGGENDEVVRRDSIIEMRSEQTAINEE